MKKQLEEESLAAREMDSDYMLRTLTLSPEQRRPEEKEVDRSQPVSMEILAEPANPVVSNGMIPSAALGGGWLSLFDGTSLTGWQSNNPEVNWKVQNAAITADEGPEGLLLTKVPFADFELICHFKASDKTNSGVFIRTNANPKDLLKDCMEINIAESHPEGFITGSIVGREKSSRPAKGYGDWLEMRVMAIGDTVTISIQGREVTKYVDQDPESRKFGFIGLQQRIGKIEFRTVIIRPINTKHLFNRDNLAGWSVVPGSKATFEMSAEPDRPASDGAHCIKVHGGPGFLQTESVHRNFLLTARFRTEAPAVNSGIFFRAEPGTEATPSNGYELQIDNSIKEDDRNAPANAGTGAIFRRVEARRVVSEDHKWCEITLIAYGPQMCVWVDGYQVVDWKDTRKPDPNPRKGLRLDAGHLSLQGHDPTTIAYFSAIDIFDYPDEALEFKIEGK
ncbi:3-keto-disaccharide hydrolase [Planctomicrobium sp. SH668]|uniref:3-keto-disaccharide hydrolase n=1 Tax=Planctomicrobium sp. SH668 TaxID=3448126 RepID=UPI003F5C2DCC